MAPKSSSMVHPTKILLASLGVIGLGLSACGSSADKTPIAGAPAPATGTATDCTAHPGKTVTVEIGNFVFNPTPVKVAVCDSVVWKNTHNQAHTSTGNGTKSWNTGNIAPGATAAPIVFDQAGPLPYMCALHPFMHGVVEVS